MTAKALKPAEATPEEEFFFPTLGKTVSAATHEEALSLASGEEKVKEGVMATTNPYDGRGECIGFGIESTPGTAVAPQFWLRWEDNSLQPKTKVAENESSQGVVDRVGDSAVTQRWTEGSLGGVLSNQAIGFLLLAMYGSVSTGAADSGIYPHTFAVNQSAVPAPLTFAKYSPLEGERYSYGVLDNLEISSESGEYVKVTAAIKARTKASASDTPSFATEKNFTSEHIVVKIAADVASLGAASALSASRVKAVIERASEPFFPLGVVDAPEFMKGAFEARGEFVVRLTDTQYESDFLANTIKAMSITLTNGTESLAFTAPKVRYRELEKTRDRDNVVTATIQFFAEYDTTTGASFTPVLRNTRASYVAA